MIKILREDVDKNSVYYKVLSKVSSGVATSEIYDQPSVGLTVDIRPTDSAVNRVASKLESLGFTEVERAEYNDLFNDSYIVFINEINGERVVCIIIYDLRLKSAFVTADYDEIEDGDYFEENKIRKR